MHWRRGGRRPAVTAAGSDGQRGPSSAGLDGGPVSWDALACAVGLLTRLEMCGEVPRAAVLAEQRPGEVLVAMEAVAAALLETLYPGDRGAAALQALGQLAAGRGAQDAPGAPQ